VDVEREPREIEIHSLSFDWIRLPEACFTVRCSRGTYVRTLACDIGEALGCGAHLLELRRTSSGLFSEADAVRVDALAAAADVTALLLPPDQALKHLKALALNDSGGRKVGNGVVPSPDEFVDELPELVPGEQVRLYRDGKFLAVAQWQTLKKLRLLRVFN
jgi:tRNA pseudouridine55 synthase